MIAVTTNYSRTCSFAPLKSRLDVSSVLTPVLPLGNTITGFILLGPEFRDRFTRVGIQSQKCDDQPMIPDVLDIECHHIPDDQLRYDEMFSMFIISSMPGNYQTCASLKNVRRVQASRDIEGRSRSPRHISGLMIEYHDHPTPNVLGQGVDQLDDAFEISLGEEILSLSIWLAPVGFSVECRDIEIGQAAAIHIETTHAREATWREADVRCDRIRAVVSPDPNQSAPSLVPELYPPFDQTQQLYFELQNHDGGEFPVLAEAYFRNQTIVGLLLVYSLGSKASIGDLDTTSRQVVIFEPRSRIIGLSITCQEFQLKEIEFHIESDQPASPKELRLSVESTEDLGSAYGTWQNVWCEDALTARRYEETRHLARDCVHEAPTGSKFVGIYAGSKIL
ncbi:hypothetical protein N7492_005377 [Penicillium capsulatum]|uniref:Uncharacterized protein n=1 Tax=Penicillium capsulatum TaxID=69766 RepID=A0A9W9I9A5_9EURO|nr:hypothetical protein N7492_005377 [Penicillium capsulatum]